MELSDGRLQYLDAMRATLMMLGVALHTSQIYNPGLEWLVSSDASSPFFFYLSQTIAAFRMPAFFFLSGFLSMMLLSRRGPAHFLRTRLKRLAVPLLSTALTLNVLQAIVLDATNWKEIGFAEYFAGGEWLQHLWFLVNLLLYVGLLTVAGMYAKSSNWLRAVSALMERIPFHVLLACLPLLQVMFAVLGKLGIPVYREIVGTMTLFSLFQYLSFFAVGCLVYSKNGLFEAFTSQRLFPLAVTLALVLVLKSYTPLLVAPLESAAAIYLQYAINWLCVCAFLRVFRVLIRRVSTPGWKYFSEASYTVYLFHHVVVICLGIVFIDLAVPAALGFALIVPTTLLITFMLHTYIVARYQPLSLLFNGRRPRERRNASRAATSTAVDDSPLSAPAP